MTKPKLSPEMAKYRASPEKIAEMVATTKVAIEDFRAEKAGRLVDEAAGGGAAIVALERALKELQSRVDHHGAIVEMHRQCLEEATANYDAALAGVDAVTAALAKLQEKAKDDDAG